MNPVFALPVIRFECHVNFCLMFCRSPWKLTRDIIRTEGVPGLFRGLASTWLREIPGYFFFFGGYEGARKMMCKPGQTQDDIGMFLFFS